MVLEFPTSRNGWKLDAVGLLAVIGETTTETCVEPMTASYLCLLPRLIPAPQALIRPNRRIALDRVTANVVGVFSGASITQLPYIANQIYPIANLAPNEVRVVRIQYKNMGQSDIEARDDDEGHPKRTATFSEKVIPPDPPMKAKTLSPHNLLSVVSTLLTIGLLIWSIIIGDGPATIAIVLLASATTLFCAASLWSAPSRWEGRKIRAPRGDVAIRSKEGAILIVHCDETIARELYFGTDNIHQVITKGFGSCVGVGTVVFMVAVIMMGNCSWTMQAALAVAYLLLNAIYWFVALMPSWTHWEFPRYEWVEVTPQDVAGPSRTTTEALWKAILETKQSAWVKRIGAVSEEPDWVEWLARAEYEAQRNNRGWEPINELRLIIARREEELNSANVEVLRSESYG